MSDDRPILNAPEYAAYRRPVLGRDDDGLLILGDRERLERTEETPPDDAEPGDW